VPLGLPDDLGPAVLAQRHRVSWAGMEDVPTVGIDAEALRRLLTRQPVILPTSAGEGVALELGQIDWSWVAELATRAVREQILEES